MLVSMKCIQPVQFDNVHDTRFVFIPVSGWMVLICFR